MVPPSLGVRVGKGRGREVVPLDWQLPLVVSLLWGATAGVVAQVDRLLVVHVRGARPGTNKQTKSCLISSTLQLSADLLNFLKLT